MRQKNNILKKKQKNFLKKEAKKVAGAMERRLANLARRKRASECNYLPPASLGKMTWNPPETNYLPINYKPHPLLPLLLPLPYCPLYMHGFRGALNGAQRFI